MSFLDDHHVTAAGDLVETSSGRKVVRCAENCGAFMAPHGDLEYSVSVEHWQIHQIPTHEDVRLVRWDDTQQCFIFSLPWVPAS